MEEICNDLTLVRQEIEKLIETFHDGKILHDGLSMCLTGCPNVGKSSIMNALLDKDRAIVSHIPGTTRDVLEDSLRINGLHVKLSDTAGIREAEEIIEQEGIRRSKAAMQQADLILLVLDAHMGLQAHDHHLLEQVPKSKTIVVWNKIDLPHKPLAALEFPYIVSISAKEKKGIENLKRKIDEIIWTNGSPFKRRDHSY